MPDKITIIDQEVKVDVDYLNLSFWGKIEIAELQKLLKLNRLKHLNASGCDLLDEHLEVIGKLVTLELLDLDSTKISDQGLLFLKSLEQLKELRLKDNPQLTDHGIEYLSNLKSLKLIHIGNTSISINGLKILLSRIDLESIILESEFNKVVNELLVITKQYPKLEITVKGVGIISNGKLNE